MVHPITAVVWRRHGVGDWTASTTIGAGTVLVAGGLRRVVLLPTHSAGVSRWDGLRLDLALWLRGGLRVDVSDARAEVWGDRRPMLVATRWAAASGVYEAGGEGAFVFSSDPAVAMSQAKAPGAPRLSAHRRAAPTRSGRSPSPSVVGAAASRT